MTLDDAAREAISQIAGTLKEDKLGFVFGYVKSIDLDANTCVVAPINSKFVSDIPNVLLQADVSDGIEFIPAIGSTVLVIWSLQNGPYVAMYSELENINMSCNDVIKLQDGSFGGLAKVEELTTKLNNLENLVNDLVAKYNLHTHPYLNVATPAVTSVTASVETTVLTPTVREDIENEKVTHGI